MNSLEALKGINIIINEAIKKDLLTLKGSIKLIGYSSIIKQDLERLKQLEIADKNNQNLVKTNVDLVNKNLKLQNIISNFRKDNQNYHRRIIKLEKELKELEEEYENLDRSFNSCHLDYENLKGEKEQLEKTIKILKEKFKLKFNEEYKKIYLMSKEYGVHIYTWTYENTEQYELLKEIFDNEN